MLAFRPILLFAIALAPASAELHPYFTLATQQEGECPSQCPIETSIWPFQNFTECLTELQTGWGGCIFTGILDLNGTANIDPCVVNLSDRAYMTIELENLPFPFESLSGFPADQTIVFSYPSPLNSTCQYQSATVLEETSTEGPDDSSTTSPTASPSCPVDTTTTSNTIIATANKDASTLSVKVSEYKTIGLQVNNPSGTGCLDLTSANYTGVHFEIAAFGKTDGVEANFIVGLSLAILGLTSLLY